MRCLHVLPFAGVLLIAFLASAQEASIKGPDDVVPIGKSVWLEVTGVTVEELQTGSIDVFPKGYDVQLRVLQDLRGTILVWFEAGEANALQQYDILVVAPRIKVEGAGAEQTTTASLLRLDWTIKTGKAPNPPPDPDKPTPDDPAPTKKVSGVYIYEKDQGGVPPEVAASLNVLNAKGIMATDMEEDTVNGEGETPAQYRDALRLAREVGLPAFVVTDRLGNLRAFRNPKTQEDILELFEDSKVILRKAQNAN